MSSTTLISHKADMQLYRHFRKKANRGKFGTRRQKVVPQMFTLPRTRASWNVLRNNIEFDFYAKT